MSNSQQVITRTIQDAVDQGISKQMIAKRMHSSVSIITRLERGRIDPSYDLLSRLADALDMRLDIKFLPR